MSTPHEPSRRLRWRRWLPVLLLFVLPLLVRGAALEHGSPRGYVPDTHIVRSALGMAKDRNPVPPVGKYSVYPNLLPYLLLPLYAGDFAIGRVTGRWGGQAEFKAFLQLHPEEPHLLARWLVAVLGSLLPLVLFAAARAAGLQRGAWVSGALAATCLLHVQFCTEERPWAAMTTFIALTAWGAIVHAERGSARALRWAGVAAGLAFATHQAGLTALGLCGLAWAMSPEGWRGLPALSTRLKTGVTCVALFLLVSVLLGHPYWLVHGRTAAEAVVGGAEQNEAAGALTIGGMTLIPKLRMESFTRLSRVLVGYDPVLLALGLGGVLLAMRRRGLRPVVLFALLGGAFFLTAQSDHVRYLLPFLALLALPAGLLAERLWLLRGGRAALVALLALPLAQSLRFVQLLRAEDTRAEAERRLAELPSGEWVAIDRYGPVVDLSQDSLLRLEALRLAEGGDLYGRERFRLELLQADALPASQQGIDAVRLEDVLDFDERAGTVSLRPSVAQGRTSAGELLEELDLSYLLAVRRRLGDAHPHLLQRELQGLELVWSVDPALGGENDEAFLPLEMDFPLTALWSVQRPGPRLDLYRLR